MLEGCGGDPARHAVIFCGSGSTAAINRLVDVLNIRIPADLDEEWGLRTRIPAAGAAGRVHRAVRAPQQRAAVAREHRGRRHDPRGPGRLHRPRPARARAVGLRRPAAEDRLVLGRVQRDRDRVQHVRDLAPAPRARRAVVLRLRGRGARTSRSRWTRPAIPLGYKDAVFISPHKFIGGPGTPGVLVARRELFTNRVPSMPGGGTVQYVTPSTTSTSPTSSTARRAARPRSSSRSGPASCSSSRRRSARTRSASARRRSSAGRSRSGRRTRRSRSSARTRRSACRSCRSSCATGAGTSTTTSWWPCSTTCSASSRAAAARVRGRTAIGLLGIDLETSQEFEREVARGCEGIKPGWIRVNFNYFISEAVFSFILDAVDLVAREGWRLLPEYAFEPGDRAVAPPGRPPRAAAQPPRHLVRRRADGLPGAPPPRARGSPRGLPRRGARRGWPGRRCRSRARRSTHAPSGQDFEDLRWFLLPEDVSSPMTRLGGRGLAPGAAPSAGAAS